MKKSAVAGARAIYGSPMRPLLLAVLASLLAVAPADAAFRELRIGSSQRTVDATPGSGCGTSGSATMCGDAAYPLALEGELAVRRGHRIVFDFDQPVDSVRVDGIEVQREANGNRWFGTVPRTWRPGFVRIGVFSRWSGGDQHFEAGLRVLRQRRGPVRVPKVAGLTQIEAFLALERRGLWWRFKGSEPRFFDSGPPIPPNAIMAQGPPVATQSLRPGTRVRRGTVVTLGLR